MKYLIAAITAFLLLPGASAADFEKMQDQMLAPVAQINGNCSGTLIYSDRDKKSGAVLSLILTAKHCIKSADKEVVVDFPVYQTNRVVKRESYVAKVKGRSYKSDLAVLELKDTQTFFEKVATIAPDDTVFRMGEPVWTVGYPLGFGLTITSGMFGSYETFDWPKDGVEYIRVTADMTFGNSGGSAFRQNEDGDYALIGVTTARMKDNTFMGLYTPVAAIHEYLRVVVPAMYPKTGRDEGRCSRSAC